MDKFKDRLAGLAPGTLLEAEVHISMAELEQAFAAAERLLFMDKEHKYQDIEYRGRHKDDFVADVTCVSEALHMLVRAFLAARVLPGSDKVV
jgi:hypothetical protein